MAWEMLCVAEVCFERAGITPLMPITVTVKGIKVKLKLAFAVLVVWASCAQAVPISVVGPFQFLDNRTSNDAGITPGVIIQFGARSVTPNSDGNTMGVAVSDSGGGVYSRTLNNITYDSAPNFFTRGLACPGGICDPTAFSPWQLTFTNNADTTVVNTQGISLGLTPMPFISNMLLNTSGPAPIATWTLPSNAVFDAVVVRVRDNNDLRGQQGLPQIANLIYNNYFPATTNQITLDPSWYAAGGNYSLEIDLADLRGSYISSGANRGGIMFSDTQNQSRSFFSYTPLPGGAPANVYLPMPGLQLDGTPAYNFSITNIAPGLTYFIDPLVAIGYDYAVGDGDPFFGSAVLPTGIGDNIYEIIVNGISYIVNGGDVFDFTAILQDGVSGFRVLGIETDAGLDPFNATAFITGLTFVGQGDFTGSMIPITVQVPEPSSIALLIGGLGILLRIRRKRPELIH